MLKRFVFPVVTLCLWTIAAQAQAGSVSGTLSVTVQPPALALVLSQSNPTVACNASAGTLVSQASTTGGDGNTITYSMTGSAPAGDVTDFVINSSTGAITVNTGGVASGNCNKTFSNTVTVTQP